MAEKVIVIRVGELFLKGKNRGFFERALIANIKEKLTGLECTFCSGRNRYAVLDFSDSILAEILSKLKTVFGIHSLSVGYRVRSDFEEIVRQACAMMPDNGRFRVTASRGDKAFPYNSMEINRELGGRILSAKPKLSVDLHTPEVELSVDIREDGFTYLFYDKVFGAGGMPVGTAGKGLLLLSGGIDSPVAGYMMAKRGLSLYALHFHSYPYTSEAAQKKVETLRNLLERFCGKIPLISVPFTRIQEAIHGHCSESFMITTMRRIMLRIAEYVAKENGCDCIVNGESLGQVASQTVESITVTNAMVAELPVFRPLIGFDKQDIITIANRIGTYETSVLPYEDCCTVFLPKKPVIKPKLKQCLFEEARIPSLDLLIEEAIKHAAIL